VSLTDDRRLAILDEIIAATTPPRRKAYQFSRLEYQERKGITQSQAQHELRRLVDNGQLKRQRVMLDSKWCDVFWRPEDEPQPTRE